MGVILKIESNNKWSESHILCSVSSCSLIPLVLRWEPWQMQPCFARGVERYRELTLTDHISLSPFSSETHPLLQYTYRLLPPLMVNNSVFFFLFCFVFCNKDSNSALWHLDSAERSLRKKQCSTFAHLCYWCVTMASPSYCLSYSTLTMKSKQLALVERNWFYMLLGEQYSHMQWCV
jgi:hypothetical protein